MRGVGGAESSASWDLVRKKFRSKDTRRGGEGKPGRVDRRHEVVRDAQGLCRSSRDTQTKGRRPRVQGHFPIRGRIRSVDPAGAPDLPSPFLSLPSPPQPYSQGTKKRGILALGVVVGGGGSWRVAEVPPWQGTLCRGHPAPAGSRGQRYRWTQGALRKTEQRRLCLRRGWGRVGETSGFPNLDLAPPPPVLGPQDRGGGR